MINGKSLVLLFLHITWVHITGLHSLFRRTIVLVCVISSVRSFTWPSSFRMTKLSRYCNNLDPALFFRHDGSGLCYDLVDRVQFIIVRIKLCDKTVREITLNKCKLQYIIHSIYINALQGTAHRKQAVL